MKLHRFEGMSNRKSGFVLVMLICIFCFGNSQLPILGQEKEVSVRCLDEEKKPIVGAEVWLFQHNGKRYEQTGPYETNMGGEAECAAQSFSTKEGDFDRWAYARVRGKLVGVARTAKWPNRETVNSEFELVLRPSRSIKGMVHMPDGADPTNVTVKVQVLHIKNGPDMFNFDSFPRHSHFPGLDTSLQDIFECKPNEKGTFELHDMPEVGRVYLVTKSKGMGQAQWRSDDWIMEPDAVLDLHSETRLSGTVSLPDGKPAVGVTVNARLQSGRPFNPVHMTTFSAKTNDKGEYKINGLPQAKFTLDIKHPDDSLAFQPLTDLIGEPDEELSIDIQFEKPIVISGTVSDREGKAVEGAAISAISEDMNTGFDHTTTDKEGKFDLKVPSARISLYFNSLPDGFAYPEPQIVKSIEVKKGQEPVDDIELVLERD